MGATSMSALFPVKRNKQFMYKIKLHAIEKAIKHEKEVGFAVYIISASFAHDLATMFSYLGFFNIS